MSLKVGSTYESYASLENAIAEYEKEHHVTLWKRESKTIISMAKKIIRINSKNVDKLRYYCIFYACIFGGRKHKRRLTTGTRPSSTFRKNCPAHIKVLLSQNQKYLEITAINTNHNHDVSEELNKTLPKHRRLDDEEQQRVLKKLVNKVNKKLVQQQIRKETGKLVTLKDLSNIAAKNKEKIKAFNEGRLTSVQDSEQNFLTIHNQNFLTISEDEAQQYVMYPEASQVVEVQYLTDILHTDIPEGRASHEVFNPIKVDNSDISIQTELSIPADVDLKEVIVAYNSARYTSLPIEENQCDEEFSLGDVQEPEEDTSNQVISDIKSPQTIEMKRRARSIFLHPAEDSSLNQVISSSKRKSFGPPVTGLRKRIQTICKPAT